MTEQEHITTQSSSDSPTAAGLVHVELRFAASSSEAEFKQLVVSAGAIPCFVLNVKKNKPEAKYFIGQGKVEELSEAIQAQSCDFVIINAELSPTQQRNLEKALCKRVIDRTELIFDIFAQRAKTYEGKLQVELAQLQHLSTRLVRGWTHLERQKGGIGLRGPGETQLETDRRLLRQRVKVIKSRLERVRSQRHQGRRARKRADIPTVALVGYTNVGKSSLFNILCSEHVYAKDQLFATLDPTLRKLLLPGFGPVILADTVGFIHGLPHVLVQAFRATLEEVLNADLLLHVVDVSNPEKHLASQKVQEVLKEIGAEHIPQLTVYNKSDLLVLNHANQLDSPESVAKFEVSDCSAPEMQRCELVDQRYYADRVDYASNGMPNRVWISVAQNMGIQQLLETIGVVLAGRTIHCCVRLPSSSTQAMKLRGWLYQERVIVHEQMDNLGCYQLEIKISHVKFQKIQLEYFTSNFN